MAIRTNGPTIHEVDAAFVDMEFAEVYLPDLTNFLNFKYQGCDIQEWNDAKKQRVLSEFADWYNSYHRHDQK